MNGKKLYYILKSIWMIVILLAVLIFMNRDFKELSADQAQDEKDMRLNIALVNEDQGVNKDNIEYNLGADYVKKIEKDAAHNWFTVSRGIGENGLKNGTYNLLITIPSHFSSKLLALDTVAPEKLQLNYKINANGNATLENESRSIGRKIVNDLNQQLVDLYIVSIIDNLYTAQRNIEKVYTNQVTSVNAFQNVLYQPTIHFKSALPGITAQSHSALQVNDVLTNTLREFINQPASLTNSHQEFTTDLERLLRLRAEGKLTYEAFMVSLTQMDKDLLSQETSQLYRMLDNLNQSFQTDFVASELENGQYVQQMESLNAQLLASKAEIEKQIEELTLIQNQYFETYSKPFFEQFHIYNPDDASKVTFQDVLKKLNFDHKQLTSVANFNRNHLAKMQQRLDSLPFKLASDEFADLNGIFLYKNDPTTLDRLDETIHRYRGMLEMMQSINQKIEETNTNYPQNDPIVPLLWEEDRSMILASAHYQELQRAYHQLMTERNYALQRTYNFVIHTENYRENGTIVFDDIPAAIDSLVYLGMPVVAGTEIPVPLNVSTMRFTYTFSSDFDETQPAPEFTITAKKIIQAPVTTSNPQPAPTIRVSSGEPEVTEEALPEAEAAVENPDASVAPTTTYTARAANDEYIASWQQAVDVSDFLSVRYQTAYRKYAESTGKILELYETVNDELRDFDRYPFSVFNNLLELNMTDLFKEVLNNTFANGHYKDQFNQLAALEKQAAEIERQSEQINAKLLTIQESTGQLNENVHEHLSQIQAWQQQMAEITDVETKVAANHKDLDTELAALVAMLENVKSQSERLKEASESNVKEAESVKSVFTLFDQDVSQAQKNGEALSENATVIMDQLNKELADNQDFVAAFVKVLNHAYQEGVPNNALLQFIANPVNGKAEATIQTTEINEPFTWILIMYTLGLFAAYLFATQPVTQKIQDQFKRENTRLKKHLWTTLLLGLSAIVIGIVLGILSIGELSIVKESQVVWVCMVVLFMLLFSLLNHYALKQFHIAGFAFNIFLLISYIFVTNAIGKSNGNNPMVDWIRLLNPLSIGEHNLAEILANQALNVGHLILYLLALTAFIVGNLFIWQPKLHGKEVVEK